MSRGRFYCVESAAARADRRSLNPNQQRGAGPVANQMSAFPALWSLEGNKVPDLDSV